MFPGSNYQYANIDSDDGLVPDRLQTIIWTNVGLVYWRIYASLEFNVITMLKATTHTKKNHLCFVINFNQPITIYKVQYFYSWTILTT